MKRIISIIAVFAIFAGSIRADEGMWLLPLLEKMNGKAMKELGCELTPKQIYDINECRNHLREEHIVNIESNSYNYLTGVYYIDVLNELEKIGDFLINISEAAVKSDNE